ncbi:MAG: tetratricopeptide repeat protein [Halanaerobium sp.]
MFKKIIILTLFLILISSSSLAADEPNLDEIQSLIAEGKTEAALNILNSSELDSADPDLKFYQALLLSWQGDYEESEALLLKLVESNPERPDFYTQLGRIYGWQRKFIQAEKILEKAQKLEYNSERTAILARHAEWQGNYFEAKKLLQKAAAEAETEELKAEYESSLDRINDELKAELYLEGRAVYSEVESKDLELRLGVEKDLRDGLDLDTSVGANYFENESNFIFSSEAKINQPLIPAKTSLSSALVFYNGGSRNKYEINNSFDYLINNQNLIGVNYNFVDDNYGSDYQSLELEYEHQFKKSTMVLKNTSRKYDAEWTADFSQHFDLYYPRDNYLLNFSVSHYQGGEYVLRAGVEFSDLFSGRIFDLSSLNFWLNDRQTGNLDFRLDLK